VVQNFSKALRIRFIPFNLSSLDKGCCRFERFRLALFKTKLKSARRKRSNLQQLLSRLQKLKEMNTILKALLKFIPKYKHM